MNLTSTKIIVADDDMDDRALIKKVFEQLGFGECIEFAVDGEELMKNLNEKKKIPSLIFLDLNMPKKDGRQALEEIKGSEELKKIPVIIFTTSKSNADIEKTYEIGANCFITKPPTFAELVKTIKSVTEFWFNTVTLPQRAIW